MYDDLEDGYDEEEYARRREERRQRREQRRAEETRVRQQRKKRLRRLAFPAAGLCVCALVLGLVFCAEKSLREKDQLQREEVLAGITLGEADSDGADVVQGELAADEADVTEAGAAAYVSSENQEVLQADATAETIDFWDSIVSGNGVLIDVGKDSILAQRGAKERINPASMTKIMTVLVAAEHVTDLDDTFTMTIDITDYSYVNDCSNVGYEVGEVMSIRDLFYGTVLPSGGDAAVALATYVAGSQDAFVEMMNEKAAELGLSDTTHFTNCVGIYNEDHYSTAYDMAVILKAAVDNPWCKEVLSTHVYTTEPSEEHPDGIVLSNWFLRRIEDKDTNGEVVCAKTGYVTQSGNCAASYATDDNGEEYICVTAGATSVWRCIYDQAELYQHFLPEGDAAEE